MAVNTTPTEKEECKVLVQYLRVKGHKFTHVANETGRGRNAAMIGVRNKQMGLSPGFPDYIVIIHHTLVFIEMKRRKGGVLSKFQKEWIAELEDAGQTVWVCKGADEAIKKIQEIEKHYD